MFTGIVEEAARVARVLAEPLGIGLEIESPLVAADAQLGDSVAVNGCCLTVTGTRESRWIKFDLLRETWVRTSFRFATAGSRVNVERALPANGRLHGHFVTGHIDGTGSVEVFEKRGPDWYLRVKPPAELMRYIVFKGSIALDGISLTVAETSAEHFAVWIIPHTYSMTSLGERTAGSEVNIETDLLAKYVEKLVIS